MSGDREHRFQEARSLWVEVVEVQGECLLSRVGDKSSIDEGYKLVSGNPVCLHASHSISP